MNGPLRIEPWDEFNERLVANVHPPAWQNPRPAPRYNLVVIGGGTAGLVAAAGAAGLGAKVALVEKHLLGGDCLNFGCVPSKTLLRAAKAAHDARTAERFGIRTGQVEVDFAAVMQRVRQVRANISPHDSARRFSELGVDVFLGEGRFRDRESIEVGDAVLRFKRAVIATGGRAAVPNIPGLHESGFFTNETVFSVTTLPRRLAVIGGGPIGCELAQAFRRLGSEVTLCHDRGQLLEREDEDAAAVVQEQFAAEGIRVVLRAKVVRVDRDASGVSVGFQEGTNETPRSARLSTRACDAILVAAGRAPNVQGLNLEAAGVDFDVERGIRVNDHLGTTNPRIFAAGDVCMEWKFTHAADFAARLVIQNALFLGRKRLSALTVPWCTYTDPEVARVGLNERDARERGIAVTVFTQPFAHVDRAITEGASSGFVKLIVREGSDEILGATIVGPHAGDLISEVSVAMSGRFGLGKLADVIHPYPTFAEAIRKCGDAYNRTRITRRVKSAFEKWLRWTR